MNAFSHEQNIQTFYTMMTALGIEQRYAMEPVYPSWGTGCRFDVTFIPFLNRRPGGEHEGITSAQIRGV